jgi:hypothetical protein
LQLPGVDSGKDGVLLVVATDDESDLNVASASPGGRAGMCCSHLGLDFTALTPAFLHWAASTPEAKCGKACLNQEISPNKNDQNAYAIISDMDERAFLTASQDGAVCIAHCAVVAHAHAQGRAGWCSSAPTRSWALTG